jgi:ATP-dependent RNA helicase DHX37/DHR1
LEKYIDTKLKKDENVELLKKLEAQRIDTSLLQSSKKLGRVTENKRERLQRALRERDAGLENGDGAGVLYEPRADVESSSDEADEISETTTDPSAQTGVFSTFGSGLKRPLDLAADGRPVIQKRKRRKTAKSRHVEPLLHDMSDEGPDGNIDEEDEDSWEGFETDDDTSHKFQEADKDSSGSSSQDDSDSDSESEQSSTSTTSNEARPARMSAFKAWADSHRNKALDFTPSANAVNTNETMAVASTNFKPRSPSPDPIIAESLTASAEFDKPAAAITISRDESIQKARLELPVVQEEQKIMESVRRHPVVVICGATGSGKTTQIPQMLLENGYASVSAASHVLEMRCRHYRGRCSYTRTQEMET